MKMKLRPVYSIGFAALTATFILTSIVIQSRTSVHFDPSRVPNATITPPLEQGEVWTDQDDQITREITNETERIATENATKDGVIHRDAHPKHHGCVKAFFSTEGSQLPNDLKVGVFATTSPTLSRPAWLRLSNGAPAGFLAPDDTADIRGFALKIMNVPQTPKGSQDFIAITAPRFFSRDSEDYLDLFHALRGGKLSLLSYAVRNPTNMYLISQAQVRIQNPLTTDFYTPVPLKIAGNSMRMHFRPCENPVARKFQPDRQHLNYLREGLIAGLKDSSACFDLLVQINRAPERNPVEDATREWNPDDSPWLLAGRIAIPAQSKFAEPEQLKFCENLSFNPWNADPELRPLGRINRIRKVVYETVSRFRHDRNQVIEIEPRDHNSCDGDTAPLCK